MRRSPQYAVLLAAVWLLSACNKPVDSPTQTPAVEVVAEPTDIPPSPTAAPLPTATPNHYQPEVLDPAWVAFDFVKEVCSAKWTNNANTLPCPGHLDEMEGGYIEATDHTVLEGMVSVEAPLLIGLPGSGYPSGVGLFGRYPPFTVYPGDLFEAVIACQGDSDCDLEFALEYYDADGIYHGQAFRWLYQVGDGPLKIKADIGSLAGEPVELTLVMRAQDELAGQWGVWIQPHISRDPNAEPPPTPDTEDETPGVISGMVDMSSAPPYLKDSMSGGSSPVAMVFFNLIDGTYWWIHTSLTGHPYFQMTITPGEYQVVAFAQGVGDVPYVAGGYTGSNPSCGQALQTVTMAPNGKLENIVVADWNWNCGGTAYRPAKPGGVPLP